MTGDILKWHVIVELRETDGSSYGTYKSYLFCILVMYYQYYNKWFLCRSGKKWSNMFTKKFWAIQMIELDETHQNYRDVSPGYGRYNRDKLCQLVYH